MPQLLDTPSTYRTEDFLSDANLQLADETIAEVFGMMLGLTTDVVVDAIHDANASGGNHRTAIVGFSGALRGTCEVRMDSLSARTVTSAMLGDPLVDDSDGSIGDAVGEICNMIAGGWKNRIPTLSSQCALSPPTIVSGGDYTVTLGTSAVKFTRTYRFSGQSMEVTMQCEEPSRG